MNADSPRDTAVAGASNTSPTLLRKFVILLRELLAFFVWSYVFVKLFVYDVDILVVQKFFPNLYWIVEYKLFIFLGIVAVCLFVLRSKKLIGDTLYVIFYPFILLLFRPIVFILRRRSWLLAIAVSNAFVSFFRSFRYNFIVVSLYLIAFTVSISADQALWLWLSGGALVLLLLVTYVSRVVAVFRPQATFQLYTKMFSSVRKSVQESNKANDAIRGLPVARVDPRDLEKWVGSVQLTVLFNRVSLFVGKKLREYQESGLHIVSSIVITMVLLVLTVFGFSAANFALYKIDHSYFLTQTEVGYFNFLYYSFNQLVFDTIPEIQALPKIAQGLVIVERLFALLLVGVFGSLLVSTRMERYKKQLTETIDRIEADGREMELFIADQYQLQSIDEALRELDRLRAGMLRLIYFFTEALR